jgi:cellulose synthase/poly-beta-1,6-N-acetylglucosamine synthase-like glycosyltransferase
MLFVFDALFVALAVLLLVPSVVLAIECLVAALPGVRQPSRPAEHPDARMVVVMPAHDEEAVLEETLGALIPELGPRGEVLVVADNCTDATAEIARRLGATVLEREDRKRRGKGYALSHAIDHLATDAPDVVIILDADCEVSPGGLARLAERALATDRPVQADYLLRPPREPTPLSRVSALALIVRNRVRPLGLHRLGLPCHLTGSGMAFAWRVIASAPPTHGNLVEDLQMGLDLAARGHPPLYCPEVEVTSLLPEADADARGQRRRWEHGQLSTLGRRGPRLLLDGILGFRPELIALGLDLMVPPLALLVGMLGSAVVVAYAWYWWGASATPLQILALANLAVIIAVTAAWTRFGRKVLPPRDLLSVPRYLLWKIPVYFAFLLRGRQQAWQRTRRSGERPQGENPDEEPGEST